MISYLENSQDSGATTCLFKVGTLSSLLPQESPKGTGMAFLFKIQACDRTAIIELVKYHKRDNKRDNHKHQQVDSLGWSEATLEARKSPKGSLPSR